MKKVIYLFAVLLGLQSCDKDSFDYNLYKPTSEDVDSVYFSAGSPTLIADGKASLQFVVEAYRKVSLENAKKDTMMFVDYTALPESDVKVYVDGKAIQGLEYATTDISKSKLSVYVEIGSVKSKEKQITVLPPKAVAAKRYIDVIFHVLELSPTDPAFDPLTYQELGADLLAKAVANANDVFNNKNGKDPNGAQANFEFRLAKKNATGGTLAIAGYNKITYDATWKASPTAIFTPKNFTDKINSTVAYQWDKSKFLNVYILPIAANNSLGNNRAGYQIVPTGEVALEGGAKVVNSEAEVPTNDFFTTYGLGIHRTVLFPDPSRKVEIASYFGTYYGLYPTHSIGTTVVDYVADTRKYLTGQTQTLNNAKNLLKIAVDGEKFLANNAMDDIRNPSLRNCFTQGQVDRMRLFMDRSPVRKAWSLQ